VATDGFRRSPAPDRCHGDHRRPALRPYLEFLCLGIPVAGLVSVPFVRIVALADRYRPNRWRRLVAPIVALGLLGLVSILFPQLLGNGKDIAQLAFADQIPFALLLALLVLKPAATVLCLGSGVPEACLRRRWRWERCWAGVLGHAVHGFGLKCSPHWPRWLAPAPF